ncbi:MAG: DedA family protein [Acetobacteraceae bacterium]
MAAPHHTQRQENAALSPEHAVLLHHAGYGAVAFAVGIESIGIPFPGETTLLAAALYAGATHKLSIWGIIAAASAGAIAGDCVGFWLGRKFGLWLLLHFGPRVRITERRIRLGQYLFRLHGGKVVFFGRFIALLRALAAFLAGTNRMSWPRFLVFNAAGGIVWSSMYGGGAYLFGARIKHLLGPMGVALGVLAVVLVVAGVIFLRGHEERLADAAERAMPGPIVPRHGAGAPH